LLKFVWDKPKGQNCKMISKILMFAVVALFMTGIAHAANPGDTSIQIAQADDKKPAPAPEGGEEELGEDDC